MPTIPKLPKRDHKIESDISDDVRVEIADAHSATWRNNVGQLQDRFGNHVVYGLAIGSADLIRLQRVVLECPTCKAELPPIGRFVAIETKTPKKEAELLQRHWLALVETLGGISGVAKSAEQARAIVERAKRW